MKLDLLVTPDEARLIEEAIARGEFNAFGSVSIESVVPASATSLKEHRIVNERKQREDRERARKRAIYLRIPLLPNNVKRPLTVVLLDYENNHVRKNLESVLDMIKLEAASGDRFDVEFSTTNMKGFVSEYLQLKRQLADVALIFIPSDPLQIPVRLNLVWFLLTWTNTYPIVLLNGPKSSIETAKSELQDYGLWADNFDRFPCREGDVQVPFLAFTEWGKAAARKLMSILEYMAVDKLNLSK